MHLCIGTPMFAGQCTGAYTRSVTALALALAKDGGRLSPIHVGNESLIHRARNAIAWHFLNSTDATHLLFCDADQGFRILDVARMVAAGKPVIVAPVPMKKINWARVARAVKDGVAPDQLHRYTGLFNIVHLPGTRTVPGDQPFEVARGGTGFMLIERGVFETLGLLVPEYVNQCPGDSLPRGARIRHFFPTDVVDEDLRSEDYGFCDLWTRAGGTIWAAPWCEISHLGTYAFSGVYLDQYRVDDPPSSATPCSPRTS